MSESGMATLAAARTFRSPTKADAGEQAKDSETADEKPSLTSILVKSVPSGCVAAYTAFTAGIVAAVTPTDGSPVADQLLAYRWIALAVLVVAAVLITLGLYLGKAKPSRETGRKRWPVLELVSVAVSALGWGLGIPESPLLVSVGGGPTGVGTVLLIAFVAVTINFVLSSFIQNPATNPAANPGDVPVVP